MKFIFLRALLCLLVTFFCSWRLWALGPLNKDIALCMDVQQRLHTLRNYISSDHYRWDISWTNLQRKMQSNLTGQSMGYFHWTQIEFESGNVLCFDKLNPSIALYPNRLSLYPIELWGQPLVDNPALCCYMIAMPFLKWHVFSCKKSAKRGRKAIEIYLQEGSWQAKVYLDRNFNTILSAELLNREKNIKASFILKNLKKFRQGWSLHRAEFALNGAKTTLTVNCINSLEK